MNSPAIHTLHLHPIGKHELNLAVSRFAGYSEPWLLPWP
jgi:hypothetical protein